MIAVCLGRLRDYFTYSKKNLHVRNAPRDMQALIGILSNNETGRHLYVPNVYLGHFELKHGSGCGGGAAASCFSGVAL